MPQNLWFSPVLTLPLVRAARGQPCTQLETLTKSNAGTYQSFPGLSLSVGTVGLSARNHSASGCTGTNVTWGGKRQSPGAAQGAGVLRGWGQRHPGAGDPRGGPGSPPAPDVEQLCTSQSSKNAWKKELCVPGEGRVAAPPCWLCPLPRTLRRSGGGTRLFPGYQTPIPPTASAGAAEKLPQSTRSPLSFSPPP